MREIRGEDFALRQPPLDLQRADDLDQLRRDRARARLQQPRQLHGDGRAALRDAAGARIAKRSRAPARSDRRPDATRSAHPRSRSAGAEIPDRSHRAAPPAATCPSRVVNAISHSPLRSTTTGETSRTRCQRRRKRLIQRKQRRASARAAPRAQRLLRSASAAMRDARGRGGVRRTPRPPPLEGRVTLLARDRASLRLAARCDRAGAGARHHARAVHVLHLRRRHRVAARRHRARDVGVAELRRADWPKRRSDRRALPCTCA